MGFRNKGLVLAMEEEGLLPEEPVVTEQEIVPAEVEQEVAEVQEEGGDIDDLNTAIEEAVEDVKTLENTTDVLEDSVADGGDGVDEAGAEIAEIAVESLCRRLGVRRKAMPALESFKAPSSRVTATRVAIEGFKEAAKRAWEAIKLAFAKMWENIIAFLQNIFNVNERLKAAAQEALKQVASIEGKTAPETFENGSIAAGFGFTGKTTAESTNKVLETGAKVLDEFVDCSDAFEQAMKEIGDAVTAMKSAAKSQNQLLEVNQKLQDSLEKTIKDITSKLVEGTVGQNEEQLIGVFVDGKTITVKTVEENGKAIGVTIGEVQAGKSPDSKVVATLKAEECKTVLENVINTVDAADKLKAKKDMFAKFQKTADNTIKLAIDAAGKLEGVEGDSAEMKKAFEECRKATSYFGNSYGRLGVKIPTMAVKGAKLALNYVEASIKQYKAPAKAAEA